MAGTATWTCTCGRRVPARISECHCGTTRAQAEAAASRAPAAPRSAAFRPTPAASAASAVGARRPGWRARVPWRRLAPVGLILGLYGASHACIRHNASEAAWDVGLARLSLMMEPHHAHRFALAHHGSCFSRHYTTGWSGPGASTFDKEAYTQCLLEKVRADVGTRSVAEAPRRRPYQPPRETATPDNPAMASPVPLTPEPATPEPTPEPVPAGAPAEKGQLFVGEVKVSGFRRDPQLTAQVTFMAIGSMGALQSRLFCAYRVRCGDELDSGEHSETCLTLGDMRATGVLNVMLPGPAPPSAACTVDVWLNDGEAHRSNTVTVPLS
jgi:hypothetical protein